MRLLCCPFKVGFFCHTVLYKWYNASEGIIVEPMLGRHHCILCKSERAALGFVGVGCEVLITFYF